MKMDWESLLDELWSYAASDPNELVTKIRSCLKGHSSEGLLQAIALLIAQGQHTTARTLLSEFLKNHQATDEIQRRLELILYFKKSRAPQTLSIKSKQRDKEALLQEVNDLVASGKLQAAESLLLEAVETIEEPEYLSLLGRVYMLQRRPLDAAKAMQRELLLKRQQQAFVDKAPMASEDDDLPTPGDLAFLNDASTPLTALASPTAPTDGAPTGEVDDSLSFIQQAAHQLPPLNQDNWWDAQSESTPTQSTAGTIESAAGEALGTAPVIPGASSEEHATEDELAASASVKNTLKLSLPRKAIGPDEGLTNIKVFHKSGRSISIMQPAGLSSAAPQDSDDSPFAATSSPAPDVPALTPQIQDELPDECDEDDEDFALTDLALNGLTSPQLNLGLEDPEDGLDLDHDLHDLSIIELEAGREESTSTDQDDFRDLEDDYAAYAFDPDEVFDSEETLAADSTDWLADKLSREDRALQKAAELIAKANWSLSTLPLVQQIFVMSGWGATRLALEREIEKGLTPEELILAAHIKVIWADNDIYWIAFDKTGSSRLSHAVLSWPTALLIVRSFDSLPQLEEIEVFLENLFAAWYENNTLRRAFKAFARYLWFRFSNLEGCLPPNQHFDFSDPRELPAEEYSDLGLCDTLDIEKTARLRAFGVFQTKHPQEPSCYFSDKPPVIEEEELSLNASGKRRRVKAESEGTAPLTEIEDDTGCIDDVVDEAVPEWSAAPHASALHGPTSGQSTPRLEP
ncbi:tetratricopeptide repeat protein [Pseudomonas panipatensis]|uniref:tetratricopeptide repeat protein n=1 Tax=Pseudomonas panipatensis TaxID=428992 RepID=UPI0035B0E08D